MAKSEKVNMVSSPDNIELIKLALSLMDLTSLNEDDTDGKIIQLCQQAQTPAGQVAAVCVYPRFVPIARKTLQSTDIHIATVTNFPHGHDDIDIAVAETAAAVAYGADEVDVVLPYRALMNGDNTTPFALVASCKAICQPHDVLLKVIIESGELTSADLIAKASAIAIDAGADFIKTSTGKVPVNATLNSAQIMLKTLRDKGVADKVGFKAAGGVRSSADALEYLVLAEKIMGRAWLTPQHFRFGASGLLGSLLTTLGMHAQSTQATHY